VQPNEAPLVSCLMMTYNKPPKSLWLVEEAIESFVRQTYPFKELIIVNDCPTQTLQLEKPIPGVVLVNLPRRCHSLGEKANLCAALAKGDLLCRWDDDDIYLPWRLSLSVAKRGNAAYWKPSKSWWNPADELKALNSPFASCCFTREGFDKVGGYTHCGVGEDQAFERQFHETSQKVVIGRILQSEAFYLYRWATNSTHVSGFGATGYEDAGREKVVPGTWVLKPFWRRDYVAWTRQAIAEENLDAAPD
jgi:glycosyltransferase involved in cell wall biosynthesis